MIEYLVYKDEMYTGHMTEIREEIFGLLYRNVKLYHIDGDIDLGNCSDTFDAESKCKEYIVKIVAGDAKNG